MNSLPTSASPTWDWTPPAVNEALKAKVAELVPQLNWVKPTVSPKRAVRCAIAAQGPRRSTSSHPAWPKMPRTPIGEELFQGAWIWNRIRPRRIVNGEPRIDGRDPEMHRALSSVRHRRAVPTVLPCSPVAKQALVVATLGTGATPRTSTR